MDKIDKELREGLEQVLRSAISEDTMGRVKKAASSIADEIESDLMYRAEDYLAYNLAERIAHMAERAVEEMLNGNEDQMRRYLSCEKRAESGEWIGWTGRSTGYVGPNRDIERQHPVIHGKLFEQGAVELRKKLVDAHRDLLVNERILDLEDQVRSLVAQVNKASREKDDMWERVRHIA
jgi:hypothetical protein